MSAGAWDTHFREVRRTPYGGGPKTAPSTRIEWVGELQGIQLRMLSTVRLRNPHESFETPSNMRLRDSHVGRCGHYIDLEVIEASMPITADLLHSIRCLASEADPRPVCVRPKRLAHGGRCATTQDSRSDP